MPQEVISLLKSPCVGSDHDDHGDCQDIDEGEEDDERELIQKDHELDVIASDEEFF
ncbi:GD23270 [Drosophila simulans]|uniref:GD23270 n=1 Tax=Drosophila simulans TaxID=7240 RepID=B4NV06_DROSI|nr:GD23270 [Drosophila simulans]